MQFAFNGVDFRVRFEYNNPINGTHGGKALSLLKNQRIEVACHIQTKIDGVWTDHKKGVAIKNPADPFSKGLGRRIALSRALDGQDKNFKTVVWNHYFSLYKDGKELGVVCRVNAVDQQPKKSLMDRILGR